MGEAPAGRRDRAAGVALTRIIHVVLLLVTVFPPLVTWLPNLVMGR